MAIITDLEHYKGRINGPCSACGDGDTAMEYHDYEPPERVFTLAELEALAREWRDQNHISVEIQFAVSHLLAWLARREKESIK